MIVGTVFKEACTPILAGSFGFLAAGVVLNRLVHTEGFRRHPMLMVLCPLLMSLKGNIEMTLGMRLSSAHHLGLLKTDARRIILGNMAAQFVQATVAGLFASFFAIGYACITARLSLSRILVLSFSSMVTSVVASLLLGLASAYVTLFCAKRGIDPDHVVAPIVSSAGDMVTLYVLEHVSSWASRKVWPMSTGGAFILFVGMVVIAACVPTMVKRARKESSSREVLRVQSWYPLLGALCVTSVSGMILEVGASSSMHRRLALAPLLNGVGGGVAVILASSVSSQLHAKDVRGLKPTGLRGRWVQSSLLPGPSSSHVKLRSRSSSGVPKPSQESVPTSHKNHPKRNIVMQLVVLALCAHLLGYVVGKVLGWLPQSWTGIFSYCLLGTAQSFVVLGVVHPLEHLLWKKKLDPDNYAAPLLTAGADVLGTTLLMLLGPS